MKEKKDHAGFHSSFRLPPSSLLFGGADKKPLRCGLHSIATRYKWSV
jgi:hypothetical protein